MKYFTILFIFLLFTSSIIGQELPKPCILSLASSPNLRGIKLGMTPAQVEKAIGLKIILKDYKPYLTDEIIPEVKEYRYYGKILDAKVPTQLEDVDALFLKFYNNSLYYIFVIYTKPKVAWKDTSEFASFLTDKFDLPKEAWLQVNYLSCSGFILSANILDDGRPSISLSDKKISELATVKEAKLIEKYKPKRRMLELEREKGFKP